MSYFVSRVSDSVQIVIRQRIWTAIYENVFRFFMTNTINQFLVDDKLWMYSIISLVSNTVRGIVYYRQIYRLEIYLVPVSED